MSGLHGNRIVRKCKALITFKDGSRRISELNLENNLPFSLSEMRKWIKEQEKKPVKSVKFLTAE